MAMMMAIGPSGDGAVTLIKRQEGLQQRYGKNRISFALFAADFLKKGDSHQKYTREKNFILQLFQS